MTVYVVFALAHAALAAQRKNRSMWLFVAVVLNLVFVGLRWDTGYDWPVYKDQFDYFAALDPSLFLSRLPEIQGDFGHEMGFLLLSFSASRILWSYQAFQFFLFAFFLFSFLRLCRVAGCKNPVAALLVVHLFLLFTLEFSTVRQLVAVAFFNLSLAYFIAGRRVLGVISAGLAVSMQLSAAIYVIALMVSIGATGRVWGSALAGLAAVGAMSVPSMSGYLAGILPAFAAEKLNFYFNVREYGGSLIERLHAGASLASFFVLGLHLTWRPMKRESDPWPRVIGKMLLVLSGSAIAVLGINTLRNRILYEVVLLGSVVFFSPRFVSVQTVTVRRVRLAVGGLGVILYTVFLSQSSKMAYIPYQNVAAAAVAGARSTGPARQRELWALIRSR